MTVVQSEVHTQFGPVNRKRKYEYRAGWGEKEVSGAEVLVAGVMQTSDPRVGVRL